MEDGPPSTVAQMDNSRQQLSAVVCRRRLVAQDGLCAVDFDDVGGTEHHYEQGIASVGD